MKKIIIIILLLLPINAYCLSSETAIVMDLDSGRVLLNKDMKKQKLIASTTKIMTTLVALENSSINDKVMITEEILKSYGSSIYLTVGENLTLENLLYGLMLRSGNDAAIAIAIHVGGSVEGFVKLMNEKALSLGMKDTLFLNPHGLEENNGSGNLSTAYDMALLTKEAMKNEIYKKIVSTKRINVSSNTKTYSWINKNKLLSTYKYTTGGKTGFTEKARRTLVTTAEKDNKKLIIVTLNDPNDFIDHINLFENYFSKYELYKVINKKEKIYDNYYKKNVLFIKNDFNILLKSFEVDKINKKLKLEKKYNYKNNDKVGYIEVYLENELMTTENVYIKVNNKKSFWEKFKGLL